MLSAGNITVAIGRATLLRQVSVRFRPGALGVIVGPNGAGKSTLLAVLSGERRPTAGGVHLDGEPLARWTPRQLAQRRAVLPQSSSLQFHFTVREVVALGCASTLAGAEASWREQSVAEALIRADVAHLADRTVPTLSGGERQRVHFARCLAQLAAASCQGSRVLLLDEPTASLDPAHQHHVMSAARALADEGLIVVAVVHDLNLAAAYGDSLVVLDRGEVAYDGDVRGGLTRDLLARVFHIDSAILSHPAHGGPLIVPLGVRSAAQAPGPAGVGA